MFGARGKRVIAYALIFLVGMLSGCASSNNSVVLVSPTSATLVPGQKLQLSATSYGQDVSSSVVWRVNGAISGSSSVGTITATGLYTAPISASAQSVQVGVGKQSAQATVSIFDPSHPSPGSITATQNPLVASYSISTPEGASTSIQFGTDTTYGLSTSAVPAPDSGGLTTVLVAGMRANTTYDMRAVIHLPDGSQVTDLDHTFTTGTIPADRLPNITTQLTGAGTPSPGVELLSLIQSKTQNLLCAVATDLAGNVIWYYDLPTGVSAFPIKPLPNGHMVVLTSGNVNDVREIDLAGNIINQISGVQIENSLSNIASFKNVTGAQLDHDVLPLPNGHFILLATITESVNDVPGVANGTVVMGNALIEWDPQRGVVWTWSTFDHLDLTHAPSGLSDWTHGNAVIYSPDDGDLIFSMRNQNWVIKINYKDGTGDGSIAWRLGPDGDFTLPAQQAPIEWNYGQHYPTIQSANSAGIFSLMLFNNGNNRLMDSSGAVCDSPGVANCYSSVPIFEINEYTKTASIVWEAILSPAYSICCGDALVLPNGNAEFDIAFDVNTPNDSYIEEVTMTQSPELLWRMDIAGLLAYRGLRILSLYPGQVWPAYVQQNVRPLKVPH